MGNVYVYSPTPAVKITGAMAHPKELEKILTNAIEGSLQAVGDIAVDLMKKNTKPFDFNKTLTDSIAWRTVNRSSYVPNEDHLIEAPTKWNQVDIGSHAPYAWYREYGQGVHKSYEGTEEFVAAMREWVQRKIGINTGPNATSHEKFMFYRILEHVRKGEKAQSRTQGMEPFMRPVEQKIPAIAQTVAKDRIEAAWALAARKYRV